MLKEYEILIGLNYAVKLSVSFGGKIANLQVTVWNLQACELNERVPTAHQATLPFIQI